MLSMMRFFTLFLVVALAIIFTADATRPPVKRPFNSNYYFKNVHGHGNDNVLAKKGVNAADKVDVLAEDEADGFQLDSNQNENVGDGNVPQLARQHKAVDAVDMVLNGYKNRKHRKHGGVLAQNEAKVLGNAAGL